MLGDYFKNQNPNKPVKFVATNYYDNVVYYVTDQNMVRYMLNSNVQLYQKIMDQSLLDLIIYNGYLFSEGNIQKSQRKMFGQFFHFESMQDRIQPISKYAQLLVNDINYHNSKSDGSKLSISNHMRSLTGKVVSAIFFGEEFSCKKIENESITDAIYDVITYSFQLGGDPFIIIRGIIMGHQESDRIPNFLRTKEEKRLLQKIYKVKKVIEDEIKQRIKTHSQDQKSGNKQDFLSVHLDQYFRQDRTKDFFVLAIDNIIQNYITFFFAGMDTTAAYLTASIYYLSNYPEIQEQIREEFRIHIPNLNNITLEQTKGLKIFEAFAQEVLRIQSVAPGIFHRVAIQDHKIGDLEIKKGDLLNLNIYGNSHNPLTIENPEKFDIYRWMDQKFTKNLQPFTILPFSSGPRNCIGQHLAKLEFKLTLVFLLRNFQIVREEEHKPDKIFLFLNTFKDDQIAKFIPL